MATELRRERREKQKRKRPQRRATQSTGILNQVLIGAVVVLAIVLGFAGLRAAGVFEPPPPPADVSGVPQLPPGATIGTKVELLPGQHIPVGQSGHYNSEPPTSGEHWSSSVPPAPAPWGIKDSMLPREVTTHNLEHGGVVIAYNNLSPAETDKLKGVVRALMNGAYRKIVLEPFPLGDAKVAVTSWGWILKLQSMDDVQVVQFVRAHYSDPNYAPEYNVP
jgi:uncharacterized protein DUF3105